MRRILDSRLTVLLLGLMLGMTLVAGIAVAQQGDAIHACAKNVNGQLRLVDGPADCRASETPFAWSVTGPQGPEGAQGPIGPQGPSGAVAFYQVESEPMVVVPGGFTDAVAQCDTGDVVTGGGFDVSSNDDANVWRSEPAGPSSWLVTLFNEGEIGLWLQFEAWAVCADVAS